MPIDLLPLEQPWFQTLIAAGLLVVFAIAANWIAKRILLGLVRRVLAISPLADEQAALGSIVGRLSNIVPLVVVQTGVSGIPHVPADVTMLVRHVAASLIVLTIALAIAAALRLANEVYQRYPDAADRPIKGYIQVATLVVYCAAAVLMIAALMDRSPVLLLSGLGAMAAILMLVFKDTILSLVASVQIGSNDMLRVGDWVELPQFNADGAVIDIALHTVKVQNWDKTITTIPTHRLISESFKNWRGMAESGGRRIKRALVVDQSSIRFLAPEEVAAFRRFALIRDYLDAKEAEILAWNRERPERAESVNARRITNIGTFRAYALAYLENRPDISGEMTLLVRQLQPSPAGLPLEIYCFTTTTAWARYEGIQGDVFDHLMAILPEFGLRLFQQPSGVDVSMLAAHARADAA